ncbi:RadC family protein [Clostridium neonatale]|uniref:RadC family protein n=1 Tax=Clostridium neonatale TaxID=137838 RepID=UPI0039794EC7
MSWKYKILIQSHQPCNYCVAWLLVVVGTKICIYYEILNLRRKDLIIMNKTHAKRVDIVSLKMIKESSILYANRKINSPDTVVNLFRNFLDGCDREILIVCCLNTKNEPTSISTVSIGSLNSSIVHPREVFKTAVMSNAASIIISHNHPSGDTTPSKEDINITKRIKEAGDIIGIKLLDHIIIGDKNYLSLKEEGHI